MVDEEGRRKKGNGWRAKIVRESKGKQRGREAEGDGRGEIFYSKWKKGGRR